MSFRIELFDGGEVLYVALDPDGVWDRSEFPHELVTLDYNANGRLIGIEAIGSAAKAAAQSLIGGVTDAAPESNQLREELALAFSA